MAYSLRPTQRAEFRAREVPVGAEHEGGLHGPITSWRNGRDYRFVTCCDPLGGIYYHPHQDDDEWAAWVADWSYRPGFFDFDLPIVRMPDLVPYDESKCRFVWADLILVHEAPP